jgi:hypothetical protein
MTDDKQFNTFWSFYPYYLTEHSDATCREMHFTGTLGFFLLLIAAIVFQKWWLLVLLPVCGYGFAWIGHFVFEKNKPATFRYPLYSLGSDFVMFYHILTDQLPQKLEEAKKTIR